MAVDTVELREQIAALTSHLKKEKHLRNQLDKLYEERLRLENLTIEISTGFIDLPADQIDSRIEDALCQVCESLELDFAALWQFSGGPLPSFTLTHHFMTVEMPIPGQLEAVDTFPWCLQQVMAGKVIDVCTENLPAEADLDQKTWRQFNIKSSLVFPLASGGGLPFGALSFNTVKAERNWPKPLTENLILVAQIFASGLARKHSEKILRKNETRLNLAADSAEAGLWELDFKTDLFWTTDRARTIFGYNSDQEINLECIKSSIHEDDLEMVIHALDRSINERKPLYVEYRILVEEDTVRWVVSRGRPYFKPGGEPDHLMGVTLDISERKHMENQMRAQIEKITQLKQQLEKECNYLRERIEHQQTHEEIVARSEAMKQVIAQAEQVARTDATVLIQGETGTGKEIVARLVHRLSDRKDHPLVTVNCASLPPTLVESELFGREKGAYTGALTRMTGRFEMANGATLFLDELGELPLEVQAKILRVIDQGSFERLGSSRPISVDVRIIAATNQDLTELVSSGKFRKDLYYRLNVFPILVPPLRKHPEDIPPLVWTFVRQFENKMGKRIDHISPQCMDELQQYTWPGNVRELRNIIERALIVSKNKTLEICLPSEMPFGVDQDLNLEEAERRHIKVVLKQTGWRISGKGGAAEVLGLKRTTLHSKIKKLGIQRYSNKVEI